jgi:hypothetical protein
MRARTTTDLVADIRVRTAAPATDGLVSDAELLQLADEEMRTELAQILISARSEYWLAVETQTIVSGTAAYRIPDRALGQGLRDVTVYDETGNEWNLIQVAADRRYLYTSPTSSGAPAAFTLDNGKVVLLPTPSTSGYTLRLRYYARPPRLDLLANCASIIAASDTLTFTVGGTIPTWVVEIGDTDTYVDIVRGDGMRDAILADGIATGYDGGAITLDASTPIVVADIANTSSPIGGRVDYLCRAGFTCYPPIPDELQPVLVALGCRAYAEAIGDQGAMQAANAMYQRKAAAARSVLIPRVDGEDLRIVPLGTPLRGGRRRLNSFGGVR